MSDIDARLADLGITLPEPVAPVANYVPFVQSGNTVHISGQISIGADGLVAARVGADMDLASAQAAARLCGINLIAQIQSRVRRRSVALRRVVKLGGFVNADPSFTDIPKVINGASDLMVEVFGDLGRHARSAVGVAVLPLGAAVEVDAVIEVE
jgi:enamine deaminase RidA (YjgF/YER057c/UK114 family)